MAASSDDHTAPGPDEERRSDPADPTPGTGSDYPGVPVRRVDFDFGPGVRTPFRLDSASVARIPFQAERASDIPDALRPQTASRSRVGLHVGLFLLTLLTTTLVGADHYGGFLLGFRATRLSVDAMSLLAGGLWYSVTILAILGAHEFGHYLACRYYRVDATLPYFIPLPPEMFITGTLGAVIRIRQLIRSKRALFDIGIAGPLAGFIVAVPALFLGMALSQVVPVPKTFPGGTLELGEPLLWRAASWMFFGHIADNYTLNIHPMAFAAWFGLLATVLNLFPVFQLDGGHISYAVFGRRATTVTWLTLGVLVCLCFVGITWIFWTILLFAMVFFYGPQHPPTADESEPLDRTRLIMAAVAALVFVLCFSPTPMRPLDLLK